MNFYFLVLMGFQVATLHLQQYEQFSILGNRYCTGNGIVCHERMQKKNLPGSFPSYVEEVVCEKCINENHNIEEINVTRKVNFTFFRNTRSGCFEPQSLALNAGCQICGEKVYWAYFNNIY